MICTDAFTITKDQQRGCRDWLRCRPTADERKELELQTGGHFAPDVSRAEILLVSLALRADADPEVVRILPTINDFVLWLSEVDGEPEETPEEPEEKTEDDIFVEKMCDIIDTLREENEELRARLKELDP